MADGYPVRPEAAPRKRKLVRRRGGADGAAAHEDGTGTAKRPASAGVGAVRTIEPAAPGLRAELSNVWRHRAAFAYFVRSFMRKRYGRTFFGYLWLFLPVLVPLFLGSVVYGGILGVSTGAVPYFLSFLVASGSWYAFASTGYFSIRSLEISRTELRRVYVPRLIPLTAAMTLPMVNLLLITVLGAGAVVFYVLQRGEFYLALSLTTLLVPVGIAMLVVAGLSCGLCFAPLAARARDVRRMAGYVFGFWYFLTPVIYPIEEIPSNYQVLASLNPVTAPIEMVKAGLFGSGEVTAIGLGSYALFLVVVGFIGLRIFGRNERRAIDTYY